MKRTCCLLVLVTLSLSAQEVDLTRSVQSLKRNIHSSKAGERLMWMDSLSKLIEYRTDFAYDSIARQTIDYALELDSTRLALDHSIALLTHISRGLGKPEQAIGFFHGIRDRVPNAPYSLELTEFYTRGAYCYQMLNRYAEALEIHEQAYTFALNAGDRMKMGSIKEKIGTVLSFMGEFQQSAAALEEAHQILKDHSDPRMAWRPKGTLAVLYSQNGLPEEAKKIRMEMIAAARGYGRDATVFDQFCNQAFDEMLNGRPKEQLKYLDSAKVYLYIPDNEEYDIQQFLATQLGAYAENGMLEKAEAVKLDLDKRKEENEYFEIEGYNLALGQYEMARGNFKDAAIFGEREYANVKDSQFYEAIAIAHGFLARVYDSLGDQGRTNAHLKAYHRIKDSIESVQKANAFSYYQGLYEAERKDSEIASQKSEIALLNAKNRVANQLMVFGGLGILALLLIFYLVRLQYATKREQQVQVQFSRNLIKGQEGERTRVARELHDGVGQKLMLLAKRTKLSGDSEMASLATDTLEELRSVSRDLHPATLEKLGFSGAVRAIIDEVDANTDIFFTHNIDEVDDLLNDESSLQLYRIVQELLNNIVKHSGAKAVSVDIERKADGIAMVVRDNGKGFSVREKLRDTSSLGMRTLLERAKIAGAKFHVESKAAIGTTISLEMGV
ncbi:hypothetical protein FGF1_40860 [Flavobacteriaceae bacterium GF1]